MDPSQYPVLGIYRNDTEADFHIYLELIPEEVVLSPGHEIELLAKPSPDLLPLTVCLDGDGLQIFAHKDFDPDWHVRFQGRVIKVGSPTVLSDLE
ncbi:MAG: hypothetical protein JF607_16930 [Burkholderiales bacterium]|jgi:hypothetical protein|nr:hypothetical protein [Burkholderiales bacterium]